MEYYDKETIEKGFIMMYTVSSFVAESREQLEQVLDNIKNYGKKQDIIYLNHHRMSFMDKVHLLGLGMAIMGCAIEAYEVKVAHREDISAWQVNKLVFMNC